VRRGHSIALNIYSIISVQVVPGEVEVQVSVRVQESVQVQESVGG